MPELPEVETVCRGLAKALVGAHITTAAAHRLDLRAPLPLDLGRRLRGQKITAVSRRAKYILITLQKDNLKRHALKTDTLLLHLGMSGRMVISKNNEPLRKHDHISLAFDNGLHVRFNDPRRFGLCDLVPTVELNAHKLMRHLGLEPLSKELTPTKLGELFKNRKTAIKLALLDQRLVVGIGNIYACEALYRACIDPRRAAGSIKPAELTRLVSAIRDVLTAAIKAGGSSLRDYVQTDGEFGYFQHQFAVYGREGEKCRECTCNIKKTGGVQRFVQGGRSTFACMTKQK